MRWLVLLLVGCGSGDRDGDGYGKDDCDDDNPAVFPGASEHCDGVDEDCDGEIDEEAVDALVVWADADGDGAGDAQLPALACEVGEGFVENDDDCDDADASRFPGADEICDGVDQDCDTRIDNDPVEPRYEDRDGDGRGNPDVPLPNCDAWGAVVADDCDDTDATVFPGAPELCDGQDNDCDGVADEDVTELLVWSLDGDGDGVGGGSEIESCESPGTGYVLVGGDCDDAAPTVFPGAAELCDGIDNDCDGNPEVAGEGWVDPAYSMRVLVDLTWPASAETALPISFDFDFAGALADAGRADPFDESTVMAVVQDCSAPTQLPVQFLDHQLGLLEPASNGDDVGNGRGAVVVLYDLDGDLDGPEPVVGGSRLTVGVYFQDGPGPQAWASDVSATAEELAVGGLSVAFDESAGGLGVLTLDASPTLLDMTSAASGNGIRTPEGGLSVQDFAGANVVQDASAITAAVKAEGAISNGDGASNYEYLHRAFAGHEEVWVTPAFRSTTAIDIVGDPDRTIVLRPFQASHGLPDAACSTDVDLHWADLTDVDWGAAWVWTEPPAYVTHLSCDAAETWSAANDYRDCCGGTTGTITNSTDFVHHPVMVWLPHRGEGREARIEAYREGVTLTVGAAESL